MARTAWPTTLRLLAHGQVRLVVFVGLLDEVGRVAAVADRFLGEEVRLLAALVDEELGEVEIVPLAGDAGELDQGEFDLLMAAIAAELAFAGPKTVSM